MYFTHTKNRTDAILISTPQLLFRSFLCRFLCWLIASDDLLHEMKVKIFKKIYIFYSGAFKINSFIVFKKTFETHQLCDITYMDLHIVINSIRLFFTWCSHFNAPFLFKDIQNLIHSCKFAQYFSRLHFNRTKLCMP